MKYLFTLLLAAFSFIAYATGSSRLTITLYGSGGHIVLNGRTYYADRSNSIEIPQISPGNHHMQIYAAGGTGRRQQNSRLIYSSRIHINPESHVDVMFNRFGRAFIDEQPLHPRPYPQAGTMPMAEYDFRMLKEQVQKQWSDHDKMQVMRTALEKNSFSVAQLLQILPLFSFESNRLEMAKAAYATVSDRHLYYLVYDVFTFRSNRDELAKYIREYRE